MPDLLIELFSEEIPARMQAQAAKDFEKLIVGALSDRGLLFEGVKSFAGPRRLTLAIDGLPAKQPDVREERKGPRTNAPEKALEGFLRSAGVTLEQCQKQADAKGEFYVAVIERKGRETAEVIAEILPSVLGEMRWPKSMRWPQSIFRDTLVIKQTGETVKLDDGQPVTLPIEARWVRPLRSIICTFEGEPITFTFAGVKSGNTTLGHRFLSDGKPIAVRHFEDYEAALKKAHVVLDAEERKDTILHDAKQKAFALGLELIEDEGLANEVSGLAEWPVVLIGTIEDQFMDVPPEILQTSMRTHQKYFALRDPKTGEMANKFALVANMIAADGGKEIVAGNERVLRARLSDAKFFWDQDRKRTLESRVDDLRSVVFHANAGSVYDRTVRIALTTKLIGDLVWKDKLSISQWLKAHRGAILAKADLLSGIVGEFPELQGTMGKYYALHDGEGGEVADAIGDQYRPIGPADAVPTALPSMLLALADKFDLLVSLWWAGEKPTGSKDPFALRRAALGIIRIILENRLRLPLTYPFFAIIHALKEKEVTRRHEMAQTALAASGLPQDFVDGFVEQIRQYHNAELKVLGGKEATPAENDVRVVNEVSEFIADRLKVALREKGTRHDLIDAVFSLGTEDDLVRLVARVEALQSFLKTDEGGNLLAGYKRAANILKAEEKKDKTSFDGAPDPEALVLAEEKALYTELATAAELIRAEVERERFVEAMGVMAKLRGPVDAFFEAVKVNDDDPAIRKNRLLLLSRLRATLHLVADFSKIEG